MHVLKTTSPVVTVPSIDAPNSSPSNTTPDSSASQPRVSGMRHLACGHGYAFRIRVDHTALAERQQHAPLQARAEQRCVVGARAQRLRVHGPLRIGIEEGSGRRLADV